MNKIKLLKFKELSVRQINIFIVTLTIILIFIIIWLNIFLPVRTNFGKVSSQLTEVNKRIKQIEAFVPKGATVQEQVDKLKVELATVSEKVPEEEGESVAVLMEFIRALNLKVEYTKTLDRKLLLDESNKKMVIEGKSCEQLPISIKLKGTYEELINLVGTLRKSIPAHVSVARLLIEAPRDGSDKLDAILDLNLYVLTKNE